MHFDAPDREPTVEELAERRKRKLAREARKVAKIGEYRVCARRGCRYRWASRSRRADARYCSRPCKDKDRGA